MAAVMSVAATAEAARAEALKVGGDGGGRVGGVDGASVSAPVWLSINMAAWRSGAAASGWEAGNMAKRQSRGDLLREGRFLRCLHRLAAYDRRRLQE